MHYTIEPAENGNYLVLTVQGDMSRKEAMQQNLEAHAKGKELGINRYLVDVTDSRNTDSVLNNYEFAHTDMSSTEGIDRSAKVAVLVSPADHSHDFIETVAQNAGLDVTIFTDREKAVRHLTET